MKRCSKCGLEKAVDEFYVGTCSRCKVCHRAAVKARYESGQPPKPRAFKVVRATPEERFFRNVKKSPSCWEWTGYKNYKGYGVFVVRDRDQVAAHRFSWELAHGPIPEGLVLDHLCRNRSCVNPAHLEPVTNLENTLRGDNFIALHAAKTHCTNGHPFSEENTRTSVRDGRTLRVCRTCNRNRRRAFDKRQKAKVNA